MEPADLKSNRSVQLPAGECRWAMRNNAGRVVNPGYGRRRTRSIRDSCALLRRGVIRMLLRRLRTEA